MEFIKGVDLILQNPVVRWVVAIALLLCLLGSSLLFLQYKTTKLLLTAAQGSLASYVEKAQIADLQRKELEAKIETAKVELQETRRTYDDRIKKLKKTPFTSKFCDGMVKESVTILQEKLK